MDIAVELVNSVINLPDGQVIFFLRVEFTLQKNCNQSCSSNFFGLIKMTFGLVDASYSLLKWQAEN